MKLMDIDSEHLGEPDTDYQSIVRMPPAEFARIFRDLCSTGDTVVISVTKEGVKFSTRGDIGTANIVCRLNTSVDKPEDATIIEMTELISLTPLASLVTIDSSSYLPRVLVYKIADMGYIRFYLVPKLEEEEENETYVANRLPQAETKPKLEPKTKPESMSQERMAVEEIPDVEAATKLKPKSEMTAVPIEDIDFVESKVKGEPTLGVAISSIEEIDAEEVNPKAAAKTEDEVRDVEH